jgi:uncharacterized protein (DUF885 family)
VTAPSDHTSAVAPNAPSEVRALADGFIERIAELIPVYGTFWGLEGLDDRWSDLSPAGCAQSRELLADTLRRTRDVTPVDDRDRIALAVLRERLEVDLAMVDDGESQLGLGTFTGHHTMIRDIFDFMPRETDEAWESIRRRLLGVGETLRGLRTTSMELAARGVVGLRVQALVCADQCTSWAAQDGTFASLVSERQDPALDDAAAAAVAAFAEHGRWLREEYAPLANPNDGVGRDRYELYARASTGRHLDLDDTYRWGWDELRRIEDRMGTLARRLLPGASRPEWIAAIESNPAYTVPDADAFIAWSRDTIDRTFDELDGRVFDIPGALRRCDSMRVPSDLAADSYYTAPTEDFSRPGMVWHPVDGREQLPLWHALSTLHHEGVPGHHLQLGSVMLRADVLTRFQRLWVYVPAHGEGWALYAERLMHELGHLADPVYELGYLVNQELRAARVVLDIGLHCDMEIPRDQPFHPGARWSRALADEFLALHTAYDASQVRSEVARYVGAPAQAITYKVGERVWLQGRDHVKRRLGAAFDLKAFHTWALDLGPMGLDLLDREFAAFGAAGARSAHGH